MRANKKQRDNEHKSKREEKFRT